MSVPNDLLMLIGQLCIQHAIGPLPQTKKKGGNCLVGVWVTSIGLRFFEHFPLTRDGWAGAWHALVRLDSEAARLVGQEFRLAQPCASAVSCQYGVLFLGGYLPSAELIAGSVYDLKFRDDRLALFPLGEPRMLADEVEAVDISGPGLMKSGGLRRKRARSNRRHRGLGHHSGSQRLDHEDQDQGRVASPGRRL